MFGENFIRFFMCCSQKSLFQFFVSLLTVSYCRTNKIAAKLLSEMTARVLKNVLRHRLREQMRGLAFPGEEPYRQELIAYINVILGHHPESHDYWTKCVMNVHRQNLI